MDEKPGYDLGALAEEYLSIHADWCEARLRLDEATKDKDRQDNRMGEIRDRMARCMRSAEVPSLFARGHVFELTSSGQVLSVRRPGHVIPDPVNYNPED